MLEVALQGMDEYYKMVGLVEARSEVQKAQDNIRIAKDEAKDAELELKMKCKEYEAMLAKATMWASEDFKTSDECDKLKAEYAIIFMLLKRHGPFSIPNSSTCDRP